MRLPTKACYALLARKIRSTIFLGVAISGSGTALRNSAGTVVGAVLVFGDLSAERQLEEQWLRANCLEVLGLLAGHIAHDFNDLLTGVVGNVSLAGMEAGEGTTVAQILAEAEAASLQARGLTRQLLALARSKAPTRKAISLAEVLHEACDFVLRGSDARAGVEVAPDLHPVVADESQISQVIQNLLLNADEAMPTGGAISVAAGNVTVKAGDGLPVPQGDYVRVTVTDEGTGIPVEIQDRLFKARVSTKPGRNGLGLATSRVIVERHGRCITANSSPGSTCFCPLLPVGSSVGGRARLYRLVADDASWLWTTTSSLGMSSAECSSGSATT